MQMHFDRSCFISVETFRITVPWMPGNSLESPHTQSSAQIITLRRKHTDCESTASNSSFSSDADAFRPKLLHKCGDLSNHSAMDAGQQSGVAPHAVVSSNNYATTKAH